jgi:hypothetical protein
MVRRLSLTLCAVLLITLAAANPANAAPLSLAGLWNEAVTAMERWLGLEAKQSPNEDSIRQITAPGGCQIDPAGRCIDRLPQTGQPGPLPVTEVR